MFDTKEDLIDEAKKVLYGNLRTGYSRWAKENYKYICPSYPHYPHQWFWDSCFHAIVLSHFDVELAKNEIRSLLKVQKDNGFIPHVIYWRATKFRRPLAGIGAMLESSPSFFPKTTNLIQPPLIAQSVESIYKKEKNLNFLLEVVPKLKKYYTWLSEKRDPDQDGLISIIAPYESGLDQSPSYDPVLNIESEHALLMSIAGRKITFKNMMNSYNLEKIFEADYFSVEDVFVNSIYILNLKILINLLHEIDNEKDARIFYHKYSKAKEALIKKCFDKESKAFFDLYSKREKMSKILTIKSLFPIILDIDKKYVALIVKEHLLNTKEFDVAYPVPTVSRSEPSFSPSPPLIAHEPIIWRGPTWVNTNWYLVKGLRKHGYNNEADKILERTVDLIKLSGYREFFNPFTGEGYGAKHFGWSTLLVDMINDN
ncbi:trehalase-like protein [Patescibacteria group bacterium]|nr:trehalase-like protein [Patescibacteria group bacterium]